LAAPHRNWARPPSWFIPIRKILGTAYSDSTGGAVVLTRPEDAERSISFSAPPARPLSHGSSSFRAASTCCRSHATAQRQRHRRGAPSRTRIPKFKKVYYPGLPSHPHTPKVARPQQKGPGAMLSFDVGIAGSRAALPQIRGLHAPRLSSRASRVDVY